MFYFITMGILLGVFLIFPKTKKKQNLLVWIPISFIAYECLSCFWTGAMSILHISANIYTVAICNIVLSAFLIFYILKKGNIQEYYIKIEDIGFIIIYTIFLYIVWKNRYTPNLLIRFETSDPGTHLKMAMNFVNNQSVDGMYLGQVTNGLFIESLSKVFSGTYIYKAFIIKYGINFYISGLIFYAASIGYAKKIGQKIIVYVITFIYILGYPYNDMVFGFVYLQLTITVIGYLLTIMKLYIEDKEINGHVFRMLLALGCLGVGIGYTLFAPITFIAILICIIYKAKKEEWLINKNGFFFHLDFIKTGLQIFLIPTIFTVWFLVLKPAFNDSLINYENALNIEGYIYRNLYSDFLLYIVFSIYGIIISFKNKKINLCAVLLPLGFLYFVIFYIKMINQEVSTYYFYKINYLLWLLILVCFVIGLMEVLKKEKVLAICYLIGMGVLFTINFTGFEYKYYEKNINYIPFTDANSFFHIFSYNKTINERQSEIKQELVAMCDEIDNSYKDQGVVMFIGYWMDLYWYEALTNQRFEEEYKWKTIEQKVEDFCKGEYGKYILVIKESEEYLENEDAFHKLKRIYENDYAFIGICE